MNTYRQDLEAARFQIAHLRGQLVDKDEMIAQLRSPDPIPPSAPAAAAPSPHPEPSNAHAEDGAASGASPEGSSWWDIWPLPIHLGLLATYGALYGASEPSDPWSLMIASGALGAAIMCVVSGLRTLSGGVSSVGQRLLTLIAALFAAPLALAVLLFVLPVVGVIAGGGSLVVGIYSTVVGLVEWISGR